LPGESCLGEYPRPRQKTSRSASMTDAIPPHCPICDAPATPARDRTRRAGPGQRCTRALVHFWQVRIAPRAPSRSGQPSPAPISAVSSNQRRTPGLAGGPLPPASPGTMHKDKERLTCTGLRECERRSTWQPSCRHEAGPTGKPWRRPGSSATTEPGAVPLMAHVVSPLCFDEAGDEKHIRCSGSGCTWRLEEVL
jgi:hypothetical protein